MLPLPKVVWLVSERHLLTQRVTPEVQPQSSACGSVQSADFFKIHNVSCWSLCCSAELTNLVEAQLRFGPDWEMWLPKTGRNGNGVDQQFGLDQLCRNCGQARLLTNRFLSMLGLLSRNISFRVFYFPELEIG